MARFHYLTLAGQELPASFGSLALEHFGRKYRLSITGITMLFVPDGSGNAPMTPEQFIDLTLFGLRDGARKSGAGKDWQREEVADLIDDNGGVFASMQEVFRVFALDNQAPPQSEPPGDDEKKVRTKAKATTAN